MILTGHEILREHAHGNIIIAPFSDTCVNPNSYNYHLGAILKIFEYSEGKRRFRTITIPEDGIVLEPGQMYLGHTQEIIGSSLYAMSLIGRSSLGRLGLFLQLSANLGHTTSEHQWTLELMAAKRIRIYPKMIIGQVSFWVNSGAIIPYTGKHGAHNLPQESLSHEYDINRA